GVPLHICHISRAEEIELMRRARDTGWSITCEAPPHHLVLTAADAATIGAGRSEVRPRLADARDRAALRAHLAVIDCFATDHAPHTRAEKDGANPPPGFPGLETALPLYLELVRAGLLSLDELVARTVHNPRRIFGLPEQPDTWIEVDTEAEWVARGEAMHTRARWTPFEGRRMRGRVTRVVLRGQLAYADGKVLAPPGNGQDVRALKHANPNDSGEEK
ncbi:MAG: dihydroorotase, partial [Anaerolineae bacterium]